MLALGGGGNNSKFLSRGEGEREQKGDACVYVGGFEYVLWICVC